jgi:hypothetical protein
MRPQVFWLQFEVRRINSLFVDPHLMRLGDPLPLCPVLSCRSQTDEGPAMRNLGAEVTVPETKAGCSYGEDLVSLLVALAADGA